VSAGRRRWAVRLTDQAERDFTIVLRWTAEQFGRRQAATYLETLVEAIEALTQGPSFAGVRARNDIAAGLFALHVRRRRRKGRHIVYFRVNERSHVVTVLRILHDAMDPARHIG
jgi:toxin ParE1/3/4